MSYLQARNDLLSIQMQFEHSSAVAGRAQVENSDEHHYGFPILINNLQNVCRQAFQLHIFQPKQRMPMSVEQASLSEMNWTSLCRIEAPTPDVPHVISMPSRTVVKSWSRDPTNRFPVSPPPGQSSSMQPMRSRWGGGQRLPGERSPGVTSDAVRAVPHECSGVR